MMTDFTWPSKDQFDKLNSFASSSKFAYLHATTVRTFRLHVVIS